MTHPPHSSKIAVLSDIHDHVWNLEKAIQIIKQSACTQLIYCGDFCSPFIPPHLTSLGVPIYAVFGNNDEDQGMIIENSAGRVNFWPLAKEFAEIEISGQKISFCHYPKLGRLLAQTGQYSAVFHGHTHEPYQEMVGGTLLANPGAVCGIQKGKPAVASFGIYTPESKLFQIVTL